MTNGNLAWPESFASAFHDYAEYRQRGEDPECSALRLHLTGTQPGEYEDAYQRSQEARAA